MSLSRICSVESLESRLLMARPVPLEGQPWTFQGGFNGNAPYVADDYNVTINWGDGGVSLVTPTARYANNPYGPFDFSATHTYRNERNQSASTAVIIYNKRTGQSNVHQRLTGVVQDALLTGIPVTINASGNSPFFGVVANFKDANPFSTADEFVAKIYWRKGVVTDGVVTGSGGQFTVSGANQFRPVDNGRTISVALIEKDSGNNIDAHSRVVINSARPVTYGDTLLGTGWQRTVMDAARGLTQLVNELKNNVASAAGQFFTGAAEVVSMTLESLAQKPGVPVAQAADAILTYLTNNNQANHEALRGAAVDAVQQFRANPAKFMGATVANVLLSAATDGAGTAGGALLKAAKAQANRVRQTFTSAKKILKARAEINVSAEHLKDITDSLAPNTNGNMGALPMGDAAKIAKQFTLSGATNAYQHSLVQEISRVIEKNPVAAAAMRQIREAGAPIVLDFTPNPPLDGTLGRTTKYLDPRNPGEPPDVRIFVYAKEHFTASDIVSTIAHEAKHVRVSKLLEQSLYEEYFAALREFLFANLKRPTQAQRVEIWDKVARNYKGVREIPVLDDRGLELTNQKLIIRPRGIESPPGF
jgi:hypothetical protein